MFQILKVATNETTSLH